MISVCMPYFDRQEHLDRSLEAFKRLYADMDLQIVICDDGSPLVVDAPGCLVHCLSPKDRALNPCVPINRAVAVAGGDVIVLTNPEMEHREPILGEMLKTLEEAGPRGYVTASCKEGDRWLAHSTIAGGDYGRAPMPPGGQFHFCAMFYRALWDELGGFDEDYREGQAFDDNDWLWTLYYAGAEFRHRDDLVVYHHNTSTQWPEGGWRRNCDLFVSKWAQRWKEDMQQTGVS